MALVCLFARLRDVVLATALVQTLPYFVKIRMCSFVILEGACCERRGGRKGGSWRT